MQVSSWIAARVAVLVEFAVFLISSTNCSVGEHIRVFVVRRAFVLLVR
nr:MAG: hypothetical protein [Bacteriophage sp.]